ncbi:protein kinase domain-containing protein [Heyndrickxia acidiproducens]|uniref:protein kinase domain-containing protein n=1 Tax=Heyndrickxia acidiproducens TaxID=1121084 RepID=UPI0004762D65|nr:serine/threonine protein kinase [Heyndrickxia acidiproducens]
MTNSTLKNLSNISPGTWIIGKWHKQHYKVIKKLGSGANGVVYLAETSGGPAALKLSSSTESVTSEVNVLKTFAKVQGSSLGPSLLDVDDWETGNGMVPFYAMEYIKGTGLLSFIAQKDFSWAGILILQLLRDLQRIHEEGWVFGDLKPENIIVTGSPVRIRCIDVGGMTRLGRSIKEFTEFFDRGYWGMGSRKAEPSYDLFAAAMIMVNLAYPQRFSKKADSELQLKTAIHQSAELKKYEPVLINALKGKYQSAQEMRRALLDLLAGRPQSRAETVQADRKGGKPQSRLKIRRFKKTKRLITTITFIVIVSMLYFLYIYEQLL